MNAISNLLAMDREAMTEFFTSLGEKPFRTTQVLQWIYQRGITAFDDMTDLSKSLREKLQQTAEVNLPRIVQRQQAVDGTRKWLLQLADGNCIETVFIPDGERGTLCISSQVGCSLNCTFCATARQGFGRNLGVDEIVGQVLIARCELPVANNNRSITNIVLMGMGEPLLNYENVVRAMQLMLDDHGFGFSRRRVTLSTAGMVPAIERLQRDCPVSLAVSLHAANDALRNELVPLNRKYPIAKLLEVCHRYVQGKNRESVTFEYVMLAGVNDSLADARALARLLGQLPAKVNLIPFNPSPGIDYQTSDQATMDRFRDVLMAKRIMTVTRKTRGGEIDAACGQLAGKVRDRTRRSTRISQSPNIQKCAFPS